MSVVTYPGHMGMTVNFSCRVKENIPDKLNRESVRIDELDEPREAPD